MSIILDIAVVAIIVLFTVTSFRRGLVSSIVDFAGTIVSIVAASFIASSMSVSIYNQFVRDKIVESVSQALSSLPSSAGAVEQASEIMSSLPDYVTNILALMGINENNLLSAIDTTYLSIPNAVEALVYPTAVKIITAALTIILFMIFIVVIGLVSRLLTKTLNIAGLSVVNKIGGAAFGLVKALLLIMVLSLVLYFIMMFLPTDVTMAINDGVENSILYKGIYNISLPEKIISMFSVG